MGAGENGARRAKARVQIAGRSDDATVDYDPSATVGTLIRDLVSRFGLGDPQVWELYAVSGDGGTRKLRGEWRIADHLREPDQGFLRLVPQTVADPAMT